MNDTPQQRARRAFEALIAREDAAIDLELATLLIANEEYPELDVAYYSTKIDSLALRVRERLGIAQPEEFSQLLQGLEPLDVIKAMNVVLFEQERFHGNQEDYYDPRNSFLNDVLDRHKGIPIALSLLYMVIGRRLGLHFDGIGLPFHFIVRCRLPDGLIFIDPFQGGHLLSEQECCERVLHMLEGGSKFHEEWLEPVSNRLFLLRMLNNLKHSYLDLEDYERALSICDRMLLLNPYAAIERRDRGIVHLQLKHYAQALRDLSAYIRRVPNAEDGDEIRHQIKMVYQIMAMMN